jgi:hypothetical protein
MINSDRIREIEADKNDDRLQAFCRLYDALERLPDGDHKLELISRHMKRLVEMGEECADRAKPKEKPGPKKRVYWPRELAC